MDSVSVGPWGGRVGGGYSYKAEGAIIQIVIASGQAIESLTFKRNNGHGLVEFSNRIGGNSTSNPVTIDINYPTEYLTSINGTIGQVGLLTVVTSLNFVTNVTTYGPYGNASTTYFSLPMKDDVIVGFHGHAGNYIGSIGAYVIPKLPNPIYVEPWGGLDGQEWSYKVEGSITRIVISSGDVVNNITFNGNDGRGGVSSSGKLGGVDGSKTETININYPVEYLTSITGTVGDYGGLTSVTSLRFNTNLRTNIGPYGKELGTDFSLRMSGNVVVGFHGRVGRNIISIGVFVKPKSP